MCYQCGIEEATGSCGCGRPICDSCRSEDACGVIKCVACGGSIDTDVDTEFEDIGGGIHASCR